MLGVCSPTESAHQIAFSHEPNQGPISDDSESADIVVNQRLGGITERRFGTHDGGRTCDQ